MSLMIGLCSARPYSPVPPPMPSPQLLPLPLPSPPPYPRISQRRPSSSHAGTSSHKSSNANATTSPTSSRFPLDRALLAVDPASRSRPRTAHSNRTTTGEDTSHNTLQLQLPPKPTKKDAERRESRRESRHSQHEPRKPRHPSSSPPPLPLSPVSTEHHHPRSSSRPASGSSPRSSSQPRKSASSSSSSSKTPTPPVPVPPLPRSASDPPPPLSPTSPHSRCAVKPLWLREPPIKTGKQASGTTSQSLPSPGLAGGRGQNRNSTSTNSTISWKGGDAPDAKGTTIHSAASTSKENKRESRLLSRTGNGIMSPILRSFKSLPNVKSPKPDGNANSVEAKHKQRT